MSDGQKMKGFDPVESALRVVQRGNPPKGYTEKVRDQLENMPIAGGDIARFVATQIEINIAVMQTLQSIMADNMDRFARLDHALELAQRSNDIGTTLMTKFVTDAVDRAAVDLSAGAPDSDND